MEAPCRSPVFMRAADSRSSSVYSRHGEQCTGGGRTSRFGHGQKDLLHEAMIECGVFIPSA